MSQQGAATILLSADDKRLAPDLKRASSAVEGFAKSSKLSIASIAVGGAIGDILIGGIRKAMSFAGNMIAEVNETEEAQKRLNNVLKTTGEAAGFSSDQLNAIAADLEKLTGIEGEVITGMQAVMATFTNVRGDVFTDATKAAMDMADFMGTDMQGAIVQVGKALNDPIRGVSALSEVGVSFTEKQKEQIKALTESGDIVSAQRIILAELQTEYGGASDLTDSFTDRSKALSTAVSGLMEAGGQLLITFMEPFMPLAETAIAIMQDMVEPALFVADGIAEMTAAALDMLPAIGDLFPAFEEMALQTRLVIATWKEYLGIAFLEVGKWVIGVGLDIAFVFTDVIPQIISQSVERSKEAFSRFGELFQTVTENVKKNATAIWENFKAAITGGEGTAEVVDLLDGFEFTSKGAFEDINMQRAVSEAEKEIERMQEAMAEKINEEEKRLRELQKADDPLGDEVPTDPKKPSEKGRDFRIEPTDPDSKDKESAKSTEGLLALHARISAAAATRDLAKATLENAQAVAANTKAIEKANENATPDNRVILEDSELVRAIHANGEKVSLAVKESAGNMMGVP